LIKKGDTIPGICSLGIGALTLLYIFLNSKMSIIGKASDGGLGPGFFPFLCGTGLVVLGALLTLRGIRQNGTVDYFEMTAEKKQNLKISGLLILLCSILLAAWKISQAFLVCLPVYSFVVNKLFKRSTRFSIIFTIVVTAFIYFLFQVCFSITFRA